VVADLPQSTEALAHNGSPGFCAHARHAFVIYTDVEPAVAGARRTLMLTRIRSSRSMTIPARRVATIRSRNEAGMATAEYAVATVAACGFGGLLVSLLKSDAVMDLLMDLIKSALSFVL
jgi:Protein of unknown function (DUF4244)